MIVNDFDKNNVNVNSSQKEQWSILSYVINYLQHDKNYRDYYKLYVKVLEPKNHMKIYDGLKEEGREAIELDFGDNPGKLKG